MDLSSLSAQAGSAAATGETAGRLAATYRSLAATSLSSTTVASMLETEKRVLNQMRVVSKPRPLPQWQHATAMYWQLPALAHTLHADKAPESACNTPSTASVSTSSTNLTENNDFAGRLASIETVRTTARAEFDQLLQTSQRQRRGFAIVEKRLEVDQACQPTGNAILEDDSLAAFPQ